MNRQQQNCLEHYLEQDVLSATIPHSNGVFDGRDLNWALENGYLAVGASGRHELTKDGIDALNREKP